MNLAMKVLLLLFLVLVWWFSATEKAGEPSQAGPLVPVYGNESSVTVVATGLEIPWGLDFLPDGSIIFTERPGRVRLVDAQEGLLIDPLLSITEIAHVGEAGLLGIAVHPNVKSNGYVYLYYTYYRKGKLTNKVERYKLTGRTMKKDFVVIDGIPGAAIHDGGRIKFGPDGMLYITTGDAASPSLAQDKDSLAGKILRVRDDGGIPEDNPFPDSPVYSIGHRNPQGIAWDPQGNLWETEHGSRATDEVNLIERGKNYGWPIIRGDEISFGLVGPVIQSGKETWAPGGAAYYEASLFFSGLRGQSLYELVLDKENLELHRHFYREFGRLREVVLGPDKLLYVLTSNRDGRGNPSPEDDRILRINPKRLAQGGKKDSKITAE